MNVRRLILLDNEKMPKGGSILAQALGAGSAQIIHSSLPESQSGKRQSFLILIFTASVIVTGFTIFVRFKKENLYEPFLCI